MKSNVSKNNIEARGKGAKEKFKNGKKLIPVRIMDPFNGINIMGAETEDGEVVKDAKGKFVPYAAITASSESERN